MVTLSSNSLSLSVRKDSDIESEFNYVWLRDNCPCDRCFHPDTHERILVTATIPDDIAPKLAKVDGSALEIIWNENDHRSEYYLD